MEEARLKAEGAGTAVRDGHEAAPEGGTEGDRAAGGFPAAGEAANAAGCPGASGGLAMDGLPAPGREAQSDFRTERDLLGTMEIPSGDLRGIHTHRALGNFQVSGRPTHPSLIRAYAQVKKACALANAETGWLDKEVADAICRAADEAVTAIDRGERAGEPDDVGEEGTGPASITLRDFCLDALQGGAGTSTNMNVNEVLAARATEILRQKRPLTAGAGANAGAGVDGHGDPPHSVALRVDPLSHVNLHQSTNDTYPTALRVALIAKVRESAEAAALLQGAFQEKEREFAQVVTVGRTEMQSAVPMTLGAIFSGMAEAAGRDRWRTFKCGERLRVVNLGGTAVGTALTAPRKYVFRAVEILRALTGYPLARAENLVDATANADALAEVAGIVSAWAANLSKAARDLRQLAVFGDIDLPAVQAGSSIMPGKVNPVILESVIQAGMKARAECALVAEAVGEGSLQINEFLPLIADSLLTAISLATNASVMLARHVGGIRANEDGCAATVDGNPIIATAFLPLLGYAGVEALVKEWETETAGADALVGTPESLQASNSFRALNSFRAWVSVKLGAELVDRTLSPAALAALGHGEKPTAREASTTNGTGKRTVERTGDPVKETK